MFCRVSCHCGLLLWPKALNKSVCNQQNQMTLKTTNSFACSPIWLAEQLVERSAIFALNAPLCWYPKRGTSANIHYCCGGLKIQDGLFSPAK